ncbi:MAG: GAF domain-containing sensor histidine kinase [Acidimicrobiales bacterium]
MPDTAESILLSPGARITALRALPYGGLDDAARHLEIAAQVQATVSPVVCVTRWAALTYGVVFGAQQAFDGSYVVVVALAICVYLTVWRTILPLRMGSPSRLHRTVAITDVAVIAFAAGWSGGANSSFAPYLAVAIVLATFGWGIVEGAVAFAVGWGVMIAADRALVGDAWRLTAGDIVLRVATVIAAAGAATMRSRLAAAERHRRRVAGQVETLAETNDLLTMLTAVARTLPTSLTQREALGAARDQVVATFRSSVTCLVGYDEANDEWVPKVTDGCTMRAAASVEDLHHHLRHAMDVDTPILVGDLVGDDEGPPRGIAASSGSGMYIKLVSRGRTVGVLGVEHPERGHYTERDRRLLAGMADVMALTLDNARWFGRLRSLGVEQERMRVARDLHDRLGQWLTYISYELERFIDTEGAGLAQVTQLYGDVQTALDELRETLRQLESDISESRPLSVVGRELARRFAERTGTTVDFVGAEVGRKLPIPVETELLRIMQEALTNVARHAQASRVLVRWSVAEGTGELTITDNGRGFDAARGVRDSTYGLVGMRERADVIGGRITIHSAEDHGTTVVVSVGPSPVPKEGLTC